MPTKPALSSAVIDQILFAMEDQDTHCVFHLDTYTVQPLEDENLVADERVLPLPPWSSSDGFRMMREFTEGLRNPSVQAELHEVLDSGLGVFRRFKQVLKPRDFLYRQWLRFKRGFMEDAVLEWMERYPEAFGAEGHSASLTWEAPVLLATDFTCQPGGDADAQRLEAWDGEACLEAAAVLFGENQAPYWAEFLRRERQWRFGDQLWVALNPEGEWSGLLWSRSWTGGLERPAHEILLWFVDPVYRGLGLGALLLQQLLRHRSEGPVFLNSPQGGQRVEGVLSRAGFTAHGKVWSAI
jgi:GNAT superfamily N-acetyltransferase